MVVLTPWPERPDPIEESNRETIAALGEVAVETLPTRSTSSQPQSWPASPAGHARRRGLAGRRRHRPG